MREVVLPSNLAVALDRPLLSPIEFSHSLPARRGVWSSLLAVLLSDVCKTALAAFVLAAGTALAWTLLSQLLARKRSQDRATPAGGERTAPAAGRALEGVRVAAARVLGPARRALAGAKAERRPRSTAATHPVAMPFEGDGGWGKCAFRALTPAPGGDFVVAEFTLPNRHHVVSLALGQKLEFCCLGTDDTVVSESFYPYGDSGEGETGVVRVVLPTAVEGDEGGGSKFVSPIFVPMIKVEPCLALRRGAEETKRRRCD